MEGTETAQWDANSPPPMHKQLSCFAVMENNSQWKLKGRWNHTKPTHVSKKPHQPHEHIWIKFSRFKGWLCKPTQEKSHKITTLTIYSINDVLHARLRRKYRMSFWVLLNPAIPLWITSQHDTYLSLSHSLGMNRSRVSRTYFFLILGRLPWHLARLLELGGQMKPQSPLLLM